MQVKVKIDAVDLSSYMVEDSLHIESVITRRIDTCSLSVDDISGSVDIDEEDEIIISNTGETIRYFAGYIKELKIDVIGIMKRFVCKAQDYTVLLDRAIANKIYEDKTDAYIINDLCTSYLNEVDGSTYVTAVKTYDRIVFNRVTLKEAINTLAANAGFDWYLDYNKKLHFFAKETNLAPFGISEDPDNSLTYPCSGLTYKRDTPNIVNRVLVIGGSYYSDDANFEFPGNGQITGVLLPYSLHKPVGESSILVYHNTGNDEDPIWTADTVGIDHIDTLGVGGVTVLYNYMEKLLKFESAPPNLNRAVKVTGRYDVPVFMRVRSEESYNTYGRWYDGKLVNRDINSRNWAKLEGKAYLAGRAFVRESGRFTCLTDGLVSGQLIPLTNAIRGIDGNYLINKVITRILGGTQCEYTVHYGEYNPDLVDMIIANKARATQYQEKRDDEVLNELLEQAESLTLVEATDRHENAYPPNTSQWIAQWEPDPPADGGGHHVRHEALAISEVDSRWEQLKGQYCWAVKSNGEGLREIKWNFFTWG